MFNFYGYREIMHTYRSALGQSLILASLCFLPTASLANESGEWTPVTINVSWSGSGVSIDELGKTRTADVVYSGDASTKGNVVFNCYVDSPSVSFAIDPIDMRKMMTDAPKSKRMDLRRPKIYVDGKKIEGEDFIYMPAMNTYRARRVGSFKALYNATLLGSEVSVKTRHGNITLNMPPANDAFKDFGAACGLGRLAKR